MRFMSMRQAEERSCGFRGQVSGFTLLEILVALAVLGIVVAASVRSSSNAVANLSFLEARTMAHWVAMNRAAELQLAADLSREWVELTPATGEAEMAGRVWYWKVTGAETNDQDVRRVDIEVRQSEESENPTTSLSFFLGRPAKKVGA